MRPLIWLVLIALVLSACAPAATPTPTPLPTNTPLPTADLNATATAIKGTAVAEINAQLTATALALQEIADATATAVQAEENENATATAVRAKKNADATATVRASWTDTPSPTPTLPPTNTPLPRPTNTPGPSPTPRPPNTATRPPSSLSATYDSIGYETWGRPQGGCQSFDNNNPVRKFNVNVTLYNHGTEATGLWAATGFDSNGNMLTTCFYFYGDWSVAPGGSKSVTWAAFTDNGTYVALFVVTVYDRDFELMETLVQCFGPNGELIGC